MRKQSGLEGFMVFLVGILLTLFVYILEVSVGTYLIVSGILTLIDVENISATNIDIYQGSILFNLGLIFYTLPFRAKIEVKKDVKTL